MPLAKVERGQVGREYTSDYVVSNIFSAEDRVVTD